MKWLIDGYILNIHFVYDALSDTLTFDGGNAIASRSVDGNSNSIGLTGDRSHACDVIREKIYCGTKYVRDIKISNFGVTMNNFASNTFKTVTITKALQINNFVNTLYNRWTKHQKIKPDELPVNETIGSWTGYYNWYASLVTTFGNFVMQNYIKVQGNKPLKDIEENINAWFIYIKKKYEVELTGKYDSSFNKINNIEDFFKALMFFCSGFKISGYIEDGWNEELKFVDKGLSLR